VKRGVVGFASVTQFLVADPPNNKTIEIKSSHSCPTIDKPKNELGNAPVETQNFASLPTTAPLPSPQNHTMHLATTKNFRDSIPK
jgi:hypothetical protein